MPIMFDTEPALDESPERLDKDERCPECGHAVEHGEPVHYADCRYRVFEDESGDEGEDLASMHGERVASRLW